MGSIDAVMTGGANLTKIGVVAGDGVGPEVTTEALKVLEQVARPRGPGVSPPAGGYRRRALPPAPARSCPTARSASCGTWTRSCWAPSATRRWLPGCWKKASCCGSGSTSTSISTSAPSALFPGIEGPIRGKGPDDVDMVVVRENNEDLYVGAGGFLRKGTPEEVAIQTSINSRAASSGRSVTPSTWLAAARPRGRSGACRPPIAAADWSGSSPWSPRPTS